MNNQKQITSPLKAIRIKCLDCAQSSHEVKLCPYTGCALYPFRFGKNPFLKRKPLSKERKAALTANLKRGKDVKQAAKEISGQ